MQARIENPAMSVPGALEALQKLGASATTAGIPETTLYLVHLRASQINGCSVCVDIHSRELAHAGESSERILTVAAWRETPYFSDAERAALALTEAATRLADRPDPVPDGVWDEAARHYTRASWRSAPRGCDSKTLLRGRLPSTASAAAYGDVPVSGVQEPEPHGVRQIALVLRPERDLSSSVNEICAWAATARVSLVGPEEEPRLPGDVPRRPADALAEGCDAVLALGGDGTMLGALRLAAPHRVPVLGVNLGTLGYLTEVDADHLAAALSSLARGEYEVESRAGIVLSAPGVVDPQLAYNDVVLTRVPGRGQAALGLRIDGELLVRYASDGVIVATPQGSTAYAFAAGGPLVSPRARGLIVMPDAPHGLFNRAIVLSDSEALGITILSRSAPVSVERDGRLVAHADAGAVFDLHVRPDAAWVLRVKPGGFAERARRKLGITDPAGLADFDLAGHER